MNEGQREGQQTAVTIEMRADLARSDLERGLVWFLNYAAIDPSAVRVDKLDLHGAAMLPPDVEILAHRWLRFSRSVDINHDGIGRPIHVVESFFNSPEVAAAAWPRDAHCVRLDCSESQEAMDGLRSGSLNSVSFDCFTWNRRSRLPVASAKSAELVEPSSIAEANAIAAAAGFPGVVAMKSLGSGMFLCGRGEHPPVAMVFSGDSVDVEPATGAVGLVVSSLSLVSSNVADAESFVWSPDSIRATLALHGLVVPMTWDPNPLTRDLSGVPATWDADFVVNLLKRAGLSVPDGFQPWALMASMRAAGARFGG